MSREMDAKVHTEIFEWRKVIESEEFRDVWHRDDPAFPNDFQSVLGDPPRYSSDIAAAYAMEERIAELDLVNRYCLELIKIADTNHTEEEESLKYSWFLIHATPEDRCRAALKAAEE